MKTKMTKGQHFTYSQSRYVFDRQEGKNWIAHPIESAHQVFCFTPEQQAKIIIAGKSNN